MSSRISLAAVFISLVALSMCPSFVFADDGQGEGGGSTAVTSPATGISWGAATLNGTVTSRRPPRWVFFVWGPTPMYGNVAPATESPTGRVEGAVPFAAQITGLQPETVYHYRILASECGGCRNGTWVGADSTFRTSAAPSLPPTPSHSTPGQPASLTPPPPPLPTAVLGRTATLQAVSGVVTISTPSGPASVTGQTSIPLGTPIDASAGVARVSTAVDGAVSSQTVTVWGGTFTVGQRPTGSGTTVIRLASPKRLCSRRAHATAARAHQLPKLWAEDHNGRYATRGRTSVATVRGTRWETIETCAGTVTRVLRGRVSVHDLYTGRTRLVGAGHSFLARR